VFAIVWSGVIVCRSALAADELCAPLRRFVESVKPDEKRALEFHTSWGSDFKDTHDESALWAKRCVHHDYQPARAVCDFLMENGAVEFSGNNAKRVLMCLSRKTHFADRLLLHGIEISLSFGTDDRGSHVEIRYAPDEQLGGMVLSITASGY
jgi:hypothetical protein